MNCKPGDLAVIVRANLQSNIGKVCTVVAPSRILEDAWGIVLQHESSGRFLYGGGVSKPVREMDCPDSWLRPIRDNDGEDETITWAGKPQEVTA